MIPDPPAVTITASEPAKERRPVKLKVVSALKEMRALAERWRCAHKTIGFVPTMGALHEGHTALIRAARQICDRVVVSIFVNPLQFGPGEDFEAYPRDMKKDLKLLATEKVDAVFTPEAAELTPPGCDTRVVVTDKLTQTLCGLSRPGHFTGVATIVTKLVQVVRPHRAFFGQKDYQQSLVVRRLNEDLNFGIDLDILPTVREADGLAKSSRNAYLSEDERRAAPAIYQSLKLAESMLQVGERNPKDLLEAVRKRLKSEPGVEIDYVAAKNADTLEDLNILAGRVLVAAAVRIGKTRLIDNVVVDVPAGS